MNFFLYLQQKDIAILVKTTSESYSNQNVWENIFQHGARFAVKSMIISLILSKMLLQDGNARCSYLSHILVICISWLVLCCGLQYRYIGMW